MSLIQLNLPPALDDFVKSRVNAGDAVSAEDFVVDLIRNAQQRVADETLESLLLEGLASPEVCEVTGEWLEAEKQLAIERNARRSAS